MNYEYGIKFSFQEELHRGPMTKDEAEKWLSEWVEHGGSPTEPFLVSRSVSDWKEVH